MRPSNGRTCAVPLARMLLEPGSASAANASYPVRQPVIGLHCIPVSYPVRQPVIGLHCMQHPRRCGISCCSDRSRSRFYVFRSAIRGLVVKFCIVIGGNTDAERWDRCVFYRAAKDQGNWSVLSGRVQSHGELTRYWASYHSKLCCLIQVLPQAAVIV